MNSLNDNFENQCELKNLILKKMNVYQCPKCNEEFSLGTKFCQKCGCNLELEFIENPICLKCDKKFPSGTKFCDMDGSRLTSPEKLIPRCVKCSKEYSIGTKFCPEDGGAVIPEAYLYNSLSYNNTFNGSYSKASLGDRFLASLLDGFIVAALSIPSLIFYFIGIANLTSYDPGSAFQFFVFAALLYILPLIYVFIKDGLGEGQSWGKKALGLMVVYLPDNTPCTIGQSCLRSLVTSLFAIVPFVGWLIEPIMVLAADDGRRLADKAASTQVIDKCKFHK